MIAARPLPAPDLADAADALALSFNEIRICERADKPEGNAKCQEKQKNFGAPAQIDSCQRAKEYNFVYGQWQENGRSFRKPGTSRPNGYGLRHHGDRIWRVTATWQPAHSRPVRSGHSCGSSALPCRNASRWMRRAANRDGTAGYGAKGYATSCLASDGRCPKGRIEYRRGRLGRRESDGSWSHCQ